LIKIIFRLLVEAVLRVVVCALEFVLAITGFLGRYGIPIDLEFHMPLAMSGLHCSGACSHSSLHPGVAPTGLSRLTGKALSQWVLHKKKRPARDGLCLAGHRYYYGSASGAG